jgi:hypothetical protein
MVADHAEWVESEENSIMEARFEPTTIGCPVASLQEML